MKQPLQHRLTRVARTVGHVCAHENEMQRAHKENLLCITVWSSAYSRRGLFNHFSLEKQLLWLIILISRVSSRIVCSPLQFETCIKIKKENMLKKQCNISGRTKNNATLSPICWNGKWNICYQLSTWMLVLPRDNGCEIPMEVTPNDNTHTYLPLSGIIVFGPNPPYFLLFIFYRHSFHLLHRLNLILGICSD